LQESYPFNPDINSFISVFFFHKNGVHAEADCVIPPIVDWGSPDYMPNWVNVGNDPVHIGIEG